MRATRFIFVEGIVGSGKTTTAVSLTTHLRHRQIPAQFLPEGQTVGLAEHPPRMAAALTQPRAPWQDLSVGQYVERSLAKWARVAAQANQSAVLTVCDGLLFHGNLMDLLLMDADPAGLRSDVRRLLETIHDLKPVVVCLRLDNPQAIHAWGKVGFRVERDVPDHPGRPARLMAIEAEAEADHQQSS